MLFKIGFVYHKAAFDPVIDLFLADPRYDVWFALDEERRRRWGIVHRPYEPPIVEQWRRQGCRFTGERHGFDVVITGDTIRRAEDYGQTLLCFLNHGTGIKTILYRNLERNAGHRYQIFVEGPYREGQLRASGALGRSEIHVVGLPKLDPYFQGRFDDRTALLRQWGLDPARPTVLFAPTYKPTCIDVIKDAIFEATHGRHNLIIKLHHYSWMGKYAPAWQHRVFEQRIGRYPHAVLLPPSEYNVVPYMAAADTLVSEASSTVFDFLALGRIGVIYDLDCGRLKHSDGRPVLAEDNREFLREAFVHVTSPEDLPAALERGLSPTPEMRVAAEQERARYFSGLDGRAAHRVKETIERLLAEGGHENSPARQVRRSLAGLRQRPT